MTRICRECGAEHARGSQSKGGRPAEFCSPICLKAWHNRRMQRGAELYDLFMASRFELGEAKRLKVWREMNRLAALYKREDAAAGRATWKAPKETIAKLTDSGKLPRGDIVAPRSRARRRREEAKEAAQ